MITPQHDTGRLSGPRRLTRYFGSLLLIFFMYSALCAVVLLASQILLQRGVVLSLPWIGTVQEYLYFMGSRNIWQAQTDCVAFDQDLLYKPKDGACRFRNAEFDTVLTFSPEGRSTGPKPAGTGIAVLGDSHAMGWGVGDEETFAAVLQKESNRPVYNMAVASYGTARELMRLEKSGIMDKVDTVIIQYCENDLEENTQFGPASSSANREKFAVIAHAADPSFSKKLTYLWKSYRFTFKAPFSRKKKFAATDPIDFSPHYRPLMDRIREHDALRSKQVIVFYSNAHGRGFRSFPAGPDRELPNVVFVDPGLERSDYYRIDDHLTAKGHEKLARRLLKALK